ncbi:TetR/AcrR family transcriptional regulator [Streptomyces sp. NPDC021356]|uniref:TetR/AcrR family transcriptional regulator n=1 Tax=Streptomyces sp. NPDC021356 TaxID=3154900 RepID=UPI0033C8F77F
MSEQKDAPLRSDAQRNRERILKVALAELTHSGDVPLSVIAKKAGVGQGTFYRHFPDRETLVLEVFRSEMAQVAALATELLKALPPDQALREWMDHLARCAIAKVGLADAIRLTISAPDSPATTGHAAVAAAADLLLRVNENAGTIQPGVAVEDLFLALAGIWRLDLNADWKPRLTWLLDLVMDGLRAGAPNA